MPWAEPEHPEERVETVEQERMMIKMEMKRRKRMKRRMLWGWQEKQRMRKMEETRMETEGARTGAAYLLGLADEPVAEYWAQFGGKWSGSAEAGRTVGTLGALGAGGQLVAELAVSVPVQLELVLEVAPMVLLLRPRFRPLSPPFPPSCPFLLCPFVLPLRPPLLRHPPPPHNFPPFPSLLPLPLGLVVPSE